MLFLSLFFHSGPRHASAAWNTARWSQAAKMRTCYWESVRWFVLSVSLAKRWQCVYSSCLFVSLHICWGVSKNWSVREYTGTRPVPVYSLHTCANIYHTNLSMVQEEYTFLVNTSQFVTVSAFPTSVTPKHWLRRSWALSAVLPVVSLSVCSLESACPLTLRLVVFLGPTCRHTDFCPDAAEDVVVMARVAALCPLLLPFTEAPLSAPLSLSPCLSECHLRVEQCDERTWDGEDLSTAT